MYDVRRGKGAVIEAQVGEGYWKFGNSVFLDLGGGHMYVFIL